MDGPSPAISYVIIDCIDPERLEGRSLTSEP
jgi:hypothetical protein